MYLIVIGWMYVVLMMSITEETAVAGVMTFLLYGLLPVSILVYLGGSRRRRRQRQAQIPPASTPDAATSGNQASADMLAPIPVTPALSESEDESSPDTHTPPSSPAP